MVRNPRQRTFCVDVKGLYKSNYWVVRKKPSQDNLYYVFAFVPPDKDNQFFILTQEEVNRGIDEELQRAENAARAKGRELGTRFECIKWNFAEKYKNRWEILLA